MLKDTAAQRKEPKSAIVDQRKRAVQRRQALLSAGYWPIPLNGKIPVIEGWQKTRADADMIVVWKHEHASAVNTGVLTFNTPTVDIDVLDPDVADEIEQLAADTLGPNDAVRVGQAPKRAILFRTDAPFLKLSTGVYRDQDGRSHQAEVLCDGQQVVVAGTHPATNKSYSWRGDLRPGAKLPHARLPLLTQARAVEFISAAKECMEAHGWTPSKKTKTNIAAATTAKTFAAPVGERERAYARAALDGIAAELASTAEGERNNTLNNKAFRMGTMTARGWIERSSVEQALFGACQANGLNADGGRGTRATIASGLAAGERCPHIDLEPQQKVLDDDTVNELAKLDPVDYDLRRHKLVKELKIRTKTLDDKVAARRKQRKSEPPPAPPAPDIDKLAAEAKDIIATPNVLDAFAASIKQTLAGEIKSSKLLYLCATSRLFAKPMNVSVKGLSAIGKSHLRDRVFAYMPPEDVVAFTTMTEKALIYLPSDLSHKILSIAEAVSGDETKFQDYLIREIISDGRITHMVTVPGGPGELPTTQVVVKEGPIMFVTTTTRARLHPEIETRILSLETDDTETQTRRVLLKVAEIEGGLTDGDAPDLAAWIAYQRWLAAGERRVAVPYAKTLANHPDLFTKGVRMRRDFRQVVCAIQAHALLHRAYRKRDDKGRIVATIQNDYAVVHELMADRLAQGAGTKLKPNDLRVLAAVEEAQTDVGADEGVKTQTLVELLNLDQSTVNRRLIKLTATGYLENLTPGKGRTARYRANGEPTNVEVLPSPKSLLNAWKREND